MKPAPVLVLLLSPAIALAQPVPDPAPSNAPGAAVAPADPTRLPGFAVIDSIDGTSLARVEMSYLELDGDDDVTLLRFAAHVRYVDRTSGFGGYVQVPFAYAGFEDETFSQLGDLELGAIYLPRLSSPVVGLVLHAGITAPTGESSDGAAFGVIAGTVALNQLFNAVPKGITGKLGVSPTLRSGSLFARLDLGLDWNFDADGDRNLGNGLHYNLGLGVELERVALTFEFQNLTISDESDAGESFTLSSIAVSARADAGQVSPYLAVVVPVEDDTSEVLDVAITAGLDVKL